MSPAPSLPRLGTGPTVLVVGYPAPAAVKIVDRLLATDARTIAGVVSPEQWTEAALLHRAAQDTGRLRLFAGSAAEPGLGLAHTAWRLLDTADEIYGVASDQEIATRHLHEFADECPRLRELHLVSIDAVGADRQDSGAARFRRVLGTVRVPETLRTSVERLTTALSRGIAGIGRGGPVARAARPWKDVLNFDIEAALSWEDIERDLWPREAT